MHAGDTSSRVVKEKEDWVYHAVGAALMLCYLAVDSLTSTWQDNMFRQYNMGICDQVWRRGRLAWAGRAFRSTSPGKTRRSAWI